jgi:hypothetical protein
VEVWRPNWKFFHSKFIHKVNPYPLFQWYPQSTESFKISAFNAQSSRLIILVVQVGAVKMKIYVAAVEAFRKKERQDETQFTTKIGEKTS